jgi:hypothetical protein
LKRQGIIPVIPPKSNRKEMREYNKYRLMLDSRVLLRRNHSKLLK